MKKILFLTSVMFSLVACSQQTLPSRHPDQLSSRNPRIIVMSKQQYLEMERRKQVIIQNKMRAPRFKF